jgi:hypothetical protein
VTPASTPRARALTFLRRHAHIDDCAANDAAASLGLAYYASKLPGRETWSQTPEGYRIYKNVPIARTGSQEYFGRELKRNPGYKPEWNLGDNDRVTVYRPLEEVTDPAAIASFEIKSVLDEHPAGDKILIDALDEFDGYTKGHGQNIRVGDMLESGETTVIGDLVVKHPELNVKIDGGVRDVSCGYTFLLDKDSTGRYIQRKIRGNHIAIVPRGRAGSDVGIGDAEPDSSFPRSSKMPKPSAKPTSSLRDFFIGLGFKSWAKDQTDEAVADALVELGANDAIPEDEKSEAKKMDEGQKVADKKGAKDDKGDEMGDDDEHPKGCRCEDCKGGKDKKGAKDRKGGKDDDGELEEMDDKKGGKDEAEILPVEDRGKSDFSVGDAMVDLGHLRTIVAKSTDPTVRKSFNALARSFRSIQSGVKDGSPDPFVALTRPSADEGANDADDELPMMSFFNGKSHKEGLAAWNEYQNSRSNRR